MMDAHPYIFVSYAAVDRERLLSGVAALERAGVTLWLDQQGMGGGENYGTVIVDAIKGQPPSSEWPPSHR